MKMDAAIPAMYTRYPPKRTNLIRYPQSIGEFNTLPAIHSLKKGELLIHYPQSILYNREQRLLRNIK